MRSVKLLFVTRDRYPPCRPAAGAIFSEELVKRGHVIDWLLQAEKNQPSATQLPYGNGIAYIGATTDGSSSFKRAKKHIQDLWNSLGVFGLIKKGGYDLVQLKDHYMPAVFALIACRLYKVPFLYWLAYPHAEDSIYKVRNGVARYRMYYLFRGYLWKWLLYRVILPAADHIFVQSEQMKRDLAANGVPMDKMTAVPGSLDLTKIPYDIEPYLTDGVDAMGSNCIVYLGTLNRVRHLDFLLRAFAVVLQRKPDARLYMLGKGDEPEDEVFLVEVVQELGIGDNVVFTGHLDMKIAWEYIRQSAVCVSPYYPTMILNSTSPTKLVEYMAMGKPTVGNDHPEQSLVIKESGAGLCVPYEVNAFAEAIVKILDDTELAAEMGRKGREYVEKHRTNAVMTDVVEAEYLKICGDKD